MNSSFIVHIGSPFFRIAGLFFGAMTTASGGFVEADGTGSGVMNNLSTGLSTMVDNRPDDRSGREVGTGAVRWG